MGTGALGDAGALADAEAAVKAAPTDELALALIGSLYRKAGRAAEAIGALEAGVAFVLFEVVYSIRYMTSVRHDDVSTCVMVTSVCLS